MAIRSSIPAWAEPAEKDLPALRDGERLDQSTFHERYQSMPEDIHAELVGGIVHIMPSPVRKDHARPHTLIIRWLGEFEDASPGTEILVEPTTILSERSEPQPDAFLRILPSYNGQTFDQDNYINGPPELVVEVAVSSIDYDLNKKKPDYQDAGVQEYIVVLPEKLNVVWYCLEAGEYQPLQPDEDGILRSRQFPGLWLDPDALLNNNWRVVRQVVRQGVTSSEHKAWVRQMKDRKERA